MKRISPKTLKIATTAFLLLGFMLLFAGPSVLHRGPHQSRRAFAYRVTLYLGGLVVAMAGAGTGALLLVRQAREEYRQSALRNMQELMEASRMKYSKPEDESSDDA